MPFPGKPAVRRKAPPPPRKFVLAKALYDFEPENNDEELAFKEGDEIEVIERNAILEEDGWCRARLKGSKKVGLAPLEYLEIDEKASTANKPTVTAENSQPIPANPHSQLSSANAGYAADGTAIAGLMATGAPGPSQLSGASASSHQTSNSIDGTSAPTSAHNMNKLGKAMQVTGLALGTVGTAAAVIPYVQGFDTQAQPLEITDVQFISDHTQDTGLSTGSQTLIADEVNVTPDPIGSTEAVQDKYVATATPPPITDLSAFSSTPFEAQLPPDGSNSMVDLVAIDPYFAAQDPAVASTPDFSSTLAAAGIPQEVSDEADPEYATPIAVSPFAAQAVPVVPNPGVGAMAIPTEPAVPVDDQSPPVTGMTQQSTESVVNNADLASWEAGNQADNTAHDMDD